METNQFNFFCEEPVSCIRCEDIFEVHEDYQPFLKHLLDAHKFVISSPEEIADFREYVFKIIIGLEKGIVGSYFKFSNFN